MSRMCKEKGAVKHDDRLDCLSQGVKYFTDCLALSAQEEMVSRKRREWNDMIAEMIDDPQAAANHLAMGYTLEQREMSRAKTKRSSVHTWV